MLERLDLSGRMGSLESAVFTKQEALNPIPTRRPIYPKPDTRNPTKLGNKKMVYAALVILLANLV